MNIIGCLDVPTSGAYLLDGQDVGQMNRNQLAEIRNKMLGFIFQQYNLLPKLNLQENAVSYTHLNQLECEFGGDRCFGIAANMDFLLVCTYEGDGKTPELVVYKMCIRDRCRSGQIHERLWRFTAKTAYTIIS